MSGTMMGMMIAWNDVSRKYSRPICRRADSVALSNEDIVITEGSFYVGWMESDATPPIED